ncbi:DUF3284 domain-containing protein [Streptococcus equinus]|uniref:DUF3284 domain-containing protein n=1 Tax=Streptococcus equinus TaxID=1335 RepID=A0A1G9JB92_STREI|nr:DUF3284 domain-containing protein [Streptococcus equinus]SDL34790.1 protein of unknown function [Streptococcus equinus]SFQ68677.1 protein of unknown function [Streptococcus equinus]
MIENTVLSYSKQIDCPVEVVYQEVIEETLKFFKYYDNHITKLQEQMTIKKPFFTKTTKEKVWGKTTVIEMKENHSLKLSSSYAGGNILQYFLFETVNGKTKIEYQEANSFTDKSKQVNFFIVSLLYRFVFKYKAAKRLKYIATKVA